MKENDMIYGKMSESEYLTLGRLAEIMSRQESVIDTKWCVITGAPCSGKTSTINELSKLGYKVDPDITRMYVEAELNKGKTKKQIRENVECFQRTIFFKRLEHTLRLPPNELIFFDYALPDHIAFRKNLGINIPIYVWISSRIFRYFKVFIMESLPFQSDEVRTDDEADQKEINKTLGKIYHNLGYEVVRIPAATIDERIAIILENIRDMKYL